MDLKEFLKSNQLSFSERVEFNPKGMTKYMQNASESYGVKFDPDKIVFIVDDTVFGSGKDGCVIAVNGIAFKSMLQRPVYFSFDKISNIKVEGRRIFINDGVFIYDFTVVDELDVKKIFGLILNWLEYRAGFEINPSEYLKKLEYLKEPFRSFIIPLVMDAIKEGDLDQEEMTEAIGQCIDDLKELEKIISDGNLSFSHAQYIDGLVTLLDTARDFESGNTFNAELLKPKVHDRYFGQFLKGFFKPFIEKINNEHRKNSLMEKIQNF